MKKEVLKLKKKVSSKYEEGNGDEVRMSWRKGRSVRPK